MRNRIIAAIFPVIVATGTVFGQPEGGYADRFSVTRGDTINFCVSTAINPFTTIVTKLDSPAQPSVTLSSIPGGLRSLPDSSYSKGCGWPVSLSLVIPESWESGLYLASFRTSIGYTECPFVVREHVPGSVSDILVSLSIGTWQAYNSFGGKSLYDQNSTDSQRTHQVSFQRPYGNGGGSGEYYKWESKFVDWLNSEHLRAEYTSTIDLDADSSILDHYKVLIVVGHDEYWSRPERRHVENFLRRGGNLIIIGGNTCWWQVRLTDDGRTMICYKDSRLDPMTNVRDSLVTVNWSSPPVNEPENLLTGVSFRNGGYVHGLGYYPSSQGYGKYTVFRSDHWIYKGTGLQDGDTFGYRDSIVGYETDGALFTWYNDMPQVTGADSTPRNYTILGISPAAQSGAPAGTRHATMGIRHVTGGGWMFNAATTDWSHGLANDPVVQQITRNVLNRFRSADVVPEIVSWSPFRVVIDSINHDRVNLNRRSLAVGPGDTVQFGVVATDPNGAPLRYEWLADGMPVSTDSVYVYRNPSMAFDGGLMEIVARVTNTTDTAQTEWKLYHTALRIVSAPDTALLPDTRWYYRPDVLNWYGDRLTTTLISGPPWLTIDSNGIFSGNVPSSMVFPATVVFTVSNLHGQSDSQTFRFRDNGPASVTTVEAVPSGSVLRCYPNPFNPATTIIFTIDKPSLVELRVYNILGQEIATLVDEFKQADTYEVRWDASTIGLSSGTYFCRLTSRSSTLTKALILVK